MILEYYKTLRLSYPHHKVLQWPLYCSWIVGCSGDQFLFNPIQWAQTLHSCMVMEYGWDILLDYKGRCNQSNSACGVEGFDPIVRRGITCHIYLA